MSTSAWRKAAASNPAGACVEVSLPRWRTASACNGGPCVEFAMLPDSMIGLRDSKDKGAGPILKFFPDEWLAFLDGAGKHEFDLPSQEQEIARYAERFLA